MTALEVFVPGIPQPKGSTKAFVRGGRAIVTSDNPKLRPWSATVTAAIAELDAEQLAGAVTVELAFFFSRPAIHYGKRGLLPSAPKYPIGRPDVDKLERACLDSLEEAGLVRNDAQVVGLMGTKAYGEHPGVRVLVRATEDPA